METTLAKAQCEALLAAGYYGHLACYDGKDPYIVPVTYLYKDDCAYGFTREGKKIDIMRKHPRVCFQVEHIDNGFTWQSVMAWGEFQEVLDEKTVQAMKLQLAHQYGKITVRERALPVSPMITDMHKHQYGDIDNSIIYRIKIDRMTGKAAKLD